MKDYPIKGSFREPLDLDMEGLYITIAQMQFFLNRPKGAKQFEVGHQDFLRYYYNCKLYNVIYDMMEADPDCAIMYWDESRDGVGIAFPVNGKVTQALGNISSLSGCPDDEDEYDDEEDNYGIHY